jgi:thiopeptide-type bacteriocin biosynthesis protein
MTRNNIQRDFILGDPWIYFKLYSGVKTADSILTEIIDPLSAGLQKEQVISKWFFIRYSDPEFHLRIRFYLSNNQNLTTITARLNSAVKPYIGNRLISGFQSDTYTRELERYGHKTIVDSESIFFHDSLAALQMLSNIEGDEGENHRWHFACLSIDYLLNDFGLNENEKLELMNKLHQGFGYEFGMNTQLKVQLDNKFRQERQKMKSFLLREDDFYAPFYRILDKKSLAIKEIGARIRNLHQQNELEVEFNSLISSYIHMMLNRIFKSKQRLNEMVIYSLLYRFYKSEMARKLKTSSII